MTVLFVQVIVLANKADLRTRKSTRMKDVEKYVNQLNKKTSQSIVKKYLLKTSAKTGLNIDLAFECLEKAIRKRNE